MYSGILPLAMIGIIIIVPSLRQVILLFEEKRRTYSQSALEITKGEEHPCCIKYNNRTDWAKIDINQRQRALAQMAVEIWTFE